MKAWAWRVETEDDNASYRVQVENIKGKRNLNKVLKILSEWDIIGKGYNANTEEYTFIFANDFDSPHKWQRWAEQFPIYLTEITSHGNEKVRNKKLIKQGAIL
mgnify:FL=1